MNTKLDVMYVSWDAKRSDLRARVATTDDAPGGDAVTVDVSLPYSASMTLGELESLALSSARRLVEAVATTQGAQ